MSRKLADVQQVERDIIRAEWLLGAVRIAKGSPDDLVAAETHLNEALTRCRRINLVELEPDILLEWARWHRLRQEPEAARQQAQAALNIADRSEYRLKQADIHNFLAQLALDSGDIKNARHHATIGRERAECDGDPYWYKPAVEEAERLLRECKN